MQDQPDTTKPPLVNVNHPANVEGLGTELRIVPPTDWDYLEFLADKLGKMDNFWEDRMRSNPKLTFITIFANPNNFVVDVGPREGVLAFSLLSPGDHALLFGASWSRNAMRNPEKRRVAGTAALVALDINTIEGITRADNRLARRAMEDGGMVYKGRILKRSYPLGLWYNNEPVEGVKYEFTRDMVNLPRI